MALSESIAERLSYKFYASGAMTSNSQPVPATAPGASGGQVLRKVSQNLSLQRDSYASNEKRTDRQIAGFRLGMGRVPGQIQGLLSAGTYADFIEAAFRGTREAAITKSNTELTSAAADNATSTFTFAGGDPVTEGFRVGHILRFTNLSDPDNNGKNFIILGFSGASNRVVAVYPAPDTMAADTAFSVASTGKRFFIPSTGHVSRLVAIENYAQDIDVAELFTEARVTGFSLNAPPTGNTEITFNLMGRGKVDLSGASAPFFTAPTAETSTKLMAGVDGLLRVGGVNLGVVTGLQFSLDMGGNAPAVVGQNFGPEIFLQAANVTGNFTALFEDNTLISSFTSETELQLLAYLKGDGTVNSQAMTILLPAIKLTSANKSDDSSGGKVVQYQFQALKYAGAGPGIEATTIQICDTEAA